MSQTKQEISERNEYVINRYWLDTDNKIIDKECMGFNNYTDVIEAFADMEGHSTNIEKIYLAPEPENDFVCIIDDGRYNNDDRSYIIVEKAYESTIDRGLNEILYNESSYTAIQGQVLPMFTIGVVQ